MPIIKKNSKRLVLSEFSMVLRCDIKVFCVCLQSTFQHVTNATIPIPVSPHNAWLLLREKQTSSSLHLSGP